MSDISRDGIVLGDKPWWQAYYGITECARCGRSEGLSLGLQGEAYTVIACDCNYAHIRPAQRVADKPVLTLLGLTDPLDGAR